MSVLYHVPRIAEHEKNFAYPRRPRSVRKEKCDEGRFDPSRGEGLAAAIAAVPCRDAAEVFFVFGDFCEHSASPKIRC